MPAAAGFPRAKGEVRAKPRLPGDLCQRLPFNQPRPQSAQLAFVRFRKTAVEFTDKSGKPHTMNGPHQITDIFRRLDELHLPKCLPELLPSGRSHR